MDFDKMSIKYKGIKFTKEPSAGLFTIIDNTCKNVNAEKKWEEILFEIEEGHKKNKEVFNQPSIKEKFKFKIYHSAQDVIYDLREFRDRNIDNIPLGLELSMTNNTHELIRNIYCGRLNSAEETKVDKASTIWKKFNRQMDDLMMELAEPLIVMGPEQGRKIPDDAQECQLHFIRCIKPRPKPLSRDDKPGLFVHSMTLQQITYMGVLESVDLK